MTVKIAPERDGLRNLNNNLVQLGHNVVPLGIEYPTSDQSAFVITVTSMYRPAIKRFENLNAASLFTLRLT